MTSNIFALRLDLIKRFLRAKGWHRLDHPNDKLLLFTGRNDDVNRPIKLVLPSSMDLLDSQEMIFKAIRILSAIENVTIDEIKGEIIHIGYDFLRQRIVTPDNDCTLPLSIANRVINSLTDLVKISACLEEDNQPFFPKIKSIGKKFADKCRFGQTFIGSFGTSVEMPIPPPSNENPDQVPFERRIMERIARGFSTIQKSIQEADINLLTGDYKNGFNANIYETLQNLGETLENYQIEFSFSWSREYTIPKGLTQTPIKFASKDICPFLASAAKALRTCSESQDTLIIGKIVQLRGENSSIDEDIEDIEQSGNEEKKLIVIHWKANQVQIRVTLSPSQYKVACDAHRDGRTVQVQGKPEKPGRHFFLTSPHDFRLSDPE